jgi:type IV pilus assembly protein PilC
VLEAPSLLDAGKALRAEGRTIIDIQPESAAARAAAATAAPTRLRRVTGEDVLLLTNQLAVMLETGVPLTEALTGIAEQTRHTGLAHLVNDIAAEVQGGSDLSTALRRHTKLFGELYINMVAASEASGTMSAMLCRLADYLASQREMRKQIRGAMLYPVSVLCFSIIIVILMMVFVLPRFEAIYAGRQAALPTPTRILLAAGRLFQHQWYLLLGGAGGLVALAWYGLSTSAGQYWVNQARIKLPLLGPLYHKVYISRSLRTLGTMLASGVEMLAAIRITASVAGNLLYRDMWLTIADRLAEGRTLTEEVKAAPLIPSGIAQMIACGDRAGRLSEVMNRICEFCEADLRIGVKAMTSLMEPVMIIIMGFLVGGIAMALLLPIFSIGRVIAK